MSEWSLIQMEVDNYMSYGSFYTGKVKNSVMHFSSFFVDNFFIYPEILINILFCYIYSKSCFKVLFAKNKPFTSVELYF